MKAAPAIAVLACTVVFGAPVTQQRGMAPATTAEHLPASPTVLFTVVAEVDGNGSRAQVVVLWRGSPNWYLAVPQRSSGGGAASDPNANVFLVDGVDRGTMAPVLRGIHVPLTQAAPLAAAVAAAETPAVREFLQCPPTPSPVSLVCSRLRR